MSTEFHYTAINASGKRLTGRAKSESPERLREELFQKGLFLVRAEALGKELRWNAWTDEFRRRFHAVDVKTLILFTKQFKTLYLAGIPLGDVFGVLRDQTENVRLREVVSDIRRQVIEGESLAAAFGAHRDVFSPLYCAMLAAGERSGAMDAVLDRLVRVMAQDEARAVKIASAVRYPKIVCFVMAGAFVVLLNLVVPQFAAVFASSGVALPLPTQLALALHGFLTDYGLPLTVLVAAGVWGFLRWKKTPAGKLLWDRSILRLPIVGEVVAKATIARFAAVFSILLRSGVPVLDAIDILKRTVDNAAYASDFEEVRQRLREGAGIADAFSEVQNFGPLVMSLLTVGERAANTNRMMEELARHYNEEVELAVERMTEYLGPVLILALGVVVLFFALAIFMPMWDLVKLV